MSKFHLSKQWNQHLQQRGTTKHVIHQGPLPGTSDHLH